MLLWLACFALYAATTARDVLPADSGEFQLTAATWGIAHPPGYPLYTIIGALWIRLFPLGSAPFRLNLLSAALAATTLLLIAEAVRTWLIAWGTKARPATIGGLAAAALLGVASTFWAQATIANIRMPTMLFTTWGFLALARYRAAFATRNAAPQTAKDSIDGLIQDTDSHGFSQIMNPDQRKSVKIRVQNRISKITTTAPLIQLALALGLGVGHHPSIIFVAVGWAAYLILVDPKLITQPCRWWKAVPVAALAWLIPQLYLPLRDSMRDVVLAPGNLATWSGFWNHVLARGFGGDMFAFATHADLTLRLPLLPTLFRQQFSPVFLAAIGLSWLWLLSRRWKLSLALALSWMLHTFVTITYRAPQTIEYLIPAYVPMALVFGLGIGTLANSIQNPKSKIQNRKSRFTFHVSRFTFYVLLLALLLRLPQQLPNFVELATGMSIRERTAPLLEAAPADALILADWHWATPLWVLQQIEGRNPQADVAYVYPIAGQAYEDVWRARAEEAGGRSLFTTHSFDWDGWSFAPVGGGFRLYRRPLTDVPDDLDFTPIEAQFGAVKVLGYHVYGGVQPGRPIEVQLAWQATAPQTSPPSFTARLWDAEGNLLAQADRFLGSDTATDEVRFSRMTLLLPVNRCTESITLTLGGYTVQDGAFVDLGAITLATLPATCNFPRLPVARSWPGFVVGGPVLRGIDYDVRGDAGALAHLHWCGPGQALNISAADHTAAVPPLAWGECQTVRLPIPASGSPQFTFARADGSAARLISRPLPAPRADERYVPFGDEFVLVSSRVTHHDDPLVINLRWRVARPVVNDYAISVRLLDANGEWLGMHDTQPGLGALPTLKWITRDGSILDPHPFQVTASATRVAITVYERFRFTPLPSPDGDMVTFPLP